MAEKIKKPFWKRWWFITIVILFVFAVIGAFQDEKEKHVDESTKRPTQEESSIFDWSLATIYGHIIDDSYQQKGFNLTMPFKSLGIRYEDKELYQVTYTYPGDKDYCRVVDTLTLALKKRGKELVKSKYKIVSIERLLIGSGTPMLDRPLYIFVSDKTINLAIALYNDYCVEEYIRLKKSGKLPEVISKDGEAGGWNVTATFSGLNSGSLIRTVCFTSKGFDWEKDVIDKMVH